jgi:glycosyltransferase involved in cell wall biosynthesis
VRILYLISSLGRGGAEHGLLTLARSLVARGDTVDVAYIRRRPASLEGEFTEFGVEAVLLAGPLGRAGLVPRAVRLIRQRHPDLVHTMMNEANLIGRVAGLFTGTPVVSSLINETYGRDQQSAPGRPPWQLHLAQGVDVVTARRVVRFHAVTRWVADIMAPRLRIPRDRIDVVARGRDPDSLGPKSPERRQRIRQSLQLPPGAEVLLCVARQDHQKGLDVLLKAVPAVLAERPDAYFLLAGRTGDATELLETVVTELGLERRVRFLGVRDDVPDLLCGSDVFVLPSRWEGIAGVLLEAMALEVPIVASDLPPLREVVPDDRFGRLIPPDHADGLAGAVVATLTDHVGSAERAKRARERFLERFTMERVTEEMVQFYRRALR